MGHGWSSIRGIVTRRSGIGIAAQWSKALLQLRRFLDFPTARKNGKSAGV
jgi:hypothetical protein